MHFFLFAFIYLCALVVHAFVLSFNLLIQSAPAASYGSRFTACCMKKKKRKRKKKGKEAIVFLGKDTWFISKLFFSSCLFNTAWEHLPQGWIGFLWREWHRDLERPFSFWFCAVCMQGPVLCFQLCYPWFPAAQPKLETELMSFCIIHSSCIKLTNSWSPTCLEPAPIRRWNEAKQLYL